MCAGARRLEQRLLHRVQLGAHRRAEALVEGHAKLLAARAARREEGAGGDVARSATVPDAACVDIRVRFAEVKGPRDTLSQVRASCACVCVRVRRCVAQGDGGSLRLHGWRG